MAFLSAMMYTTSVHSESTKFQVHSITSSSLPQSSTVDRVHVWQCGSCGVWRIPVLPGLAAARGRVRPRRLRSAVPSAPVFQVAPPSPHFSFSGSSGRGIQYRGGALCSRALAWDIGRREGGGSGSQHAGPGAAASSLRLSRLPLGSGTGWRGRGARGSRRVRESVRFLRFVCGPH